MTSPFGPAITAALDGMADDAAPLRMAFAVGRLLPRLTPAERRRLAAPDGGGADAGRIFLRLFETAGLPAAEAVARFKWLVTYLEMKGR